MVIWKKWVQQWIKCCVLIQLSCDSSCFCNVSLRIKIYHCFSGGPAGSINSIIDWIDWNQLTSTSFLISLEPLRASRVIGNANKLLLWRTKFILARPVSKGYECICCLNAVCRPTFHVYSQLQWKCCSFEVSSTKLIPAWRKMKTQAVNIEIACLKTTYIKNICSGFDTQRYTPSKL